MTTTPARDERPYRRASEPPGAEMRTTTPGHAQRWRQIGWHGQSGAFYALDEQPTLHEPGSIAPLWLLVDNEPTDQDHAAEVRAELADTKRDAGYFKEWADGNGRRLNEALAIINNLRANAAEVRADQAAVLGRIRAVIRRLAAHAVGFQDVLDESDRGPWGKTVGADIAELRRLAATARPDRVPTRAEIADQMRVVDASQRDVDAALATYDRAATSPDNTTRGA